MNEILVAHHRFCAEGGTAGILPAYDGPSLATSPVPKSEI